MLLALSSSFFLFKSAKGWYSKFNSTLNSLLIAGGGAMGSVAGSLAIADAITGNGNGRALTPTVLGLCFASTIATIAGFSGHMHDDPELQEASSEQN